MHKHPTFISQAGKQFLDRTKIHASTNALIHAGRLRLTRTLQGV